VLTIAVVLVLALMGAGCGGGDEASSTTDTIVSEETTTDETTTDETTTEDTTTDTSGTLATGDCRELVDASAELTDALGATGTGNLQDVSALFDQLAERAPEEIRADIRTLGEAYASYADVLADIKVEPGQTPSAADLQRLQQALTSIDQQKVTAASERLSAWTQANC
jgi:hypothetical protein